MLRARSRLENPGTSVREPPGGHLDRPLRTPIVVHAVVRSDSHSGNLGRDPDATQGAGKGLFIFVRMQQSTRREDTTAAIQNLPPVGVMLPTRIFMSHRDVKTVYSGPSLGDGDADDISLACLCRSGCQSRPHTGDAQHECMS